MKKLDTNKNKNNASFIVVSEKNFKHFWVYTSTLQPHFQVYRRNYKIIRSK